MIIILLLQCVIQLLTFTTNILSGCWIDNSYSVCVATILVCIWDIHKYTVIFQFSQPRCCLGLLCIRLAKHGQVVAWNGVYNWLWISLEMLLHGMTALNFRLSRSMLSSMNGFPICSIVVTSDRTSWTNFSCLLVVAIRRNDIRGSPIFVEAFLKLSN